MWIPPQTECHGLRNGSVSVCFARASPVKISPQCSSLWFGKPANTMLLCKHQHLGKRVLMQPLANVNKRGMRGKLQACLMFVLTALKGCLLTQNKGSKGRSIFSQAVLEPELVELQSGWESSPGSFINHTNASLSLAQGGGSPLLIQRLICFRANAEAEP